MRLRKTLCWILVLAMVMNFAPAPVFATGIQKDTVEKEQQKETGSTMDEKTKETGKTGGELKATEYTITVNGAKASVDKAIKGTKVTLTKEIPEGKAFDKWEVSENVSISKDSFVMPKSNVTITAVYKDAKQDVNSGENKNLNSFDIKNIQQTNENTSADEIVDSTSHYTVSFEQPAEANIQAEAWVDSAKLDPSQGVATGVTVTLKITSDLPEGYQLQGWQEVNVPQGEDPVAVTENQFVMPTRNVVFAPVFGYKVTTINDDLPSDNKNAVMTATPEYAQAGQEVILSISGIDADKYQLWKWQEHDVPVGRNSVNISDNKFTMPKGPVTIGAVLKDRKINITVEYKSLCDDKTIENVKSELNPSLKNSSGAACLGNIGFPENHLEYLCPGWDFIGWEIEGKMNPSPLPHDIELKKEHDGYTFVAQYEKLPVVNLSFQSNGGEGTMPSMESYKGAKIQLPACTFSAPKGQMFKAWLINGVEHKEGASYTVPDGNPVTVTAEWIVIPKKQVTEKDTEWTDGVWTVAKDITLQNRVKITGNVTLKLQEGCTLTVPGDRTLTVPGGILLQGEEGNHLASRLTIEGPGTLKVTNTIGNNIGPEKGFDGGILVINGGTIELGEKIGSTSYAVMAESIEINGGQITAKNHYGLRADGNDGITVKNATVKVFSGENLGIDATGRNDFQSYVSKGLRISDGGKVIVRDFREHANAKEIAGKVSLEGDGSAFVDASIIHASVAMRSEWKGFASEDAGKTITAYNAVIANNSELSAEKELLVPQGKTLTLNQSVTLTANGNITNKGTITCNGKIINNKQLNNQNVLNGSGIIDTTNGKFYNSGTVTGVTVTPKNGQKNVVGLSLAASGADVTFKSGAEKLADNDYLIDKDNPVTFKVQVKDGFMLNQVEAVPSNGDAKVLTAQAGVYTIPENQKTGTITLNIKTTKIGGDISNGAIFSDCIDGGSSGQFLYKENLTRYKAGEGYIEVKKGDEKTPATVILHNATIKGTLELVQFQTEAVITVEGINQVTKLLLQGSKDGVKNTVTLKSEDKGKLTIPNDLMVNNIGFTNQCGDGLSAIVQYDADMVLNKGLVYGTIRKSNRINYGSWMESNSFHGQSMMSELTITEGSKFTLDALGTWMIANNGSHVINKGTVENNGTIYLETADPYNSTAVKATIQKLKLTGSGRVMAGGKFQNPNSDGVDSKNYTFADTENVAEYTNEGNRVYRLKKINSHTGKAEITVGDNLGEDSKIGEKDITFTVSQLPEGYAEQRVTCKVGTAQPETLQPTSGNNYTIAKEKITGDIIISAVAIPKAPAKNEGYTINYTTEEITVTSGYEVNTAMDFTGTAVENDGKVTPGGTYYIRKAKTGDNPAQGHDPAGFTSSFKLPERPQIASVVTGNYKPSRTQDKVDFTIQQIAGAEYKVDNGDWQTSNVFMALDPGVAHNFVARIAAIDTCFAGVEKASGEKTYTRVAGSATVTIDSWTYGQQAKEPNGQSDTNKVTPVYTYAEKGSTAFTAQVPTQAGTYLVKAFFAETPVYQAVSATREFTIEKAVPTAELFEGVDTTVCYNGEAQKPVITAKEKDTGLGTVTVTTVETNACTKDQVFFDVAEGKNYQAKDGMSISKKFIITPKPLDWDVSGLSANKRYDGSQKAAIVYGKLAVTGVVEKDEIGLTQKNLALPDFRNADPGEYQLQLSGDVAIRNDNYTLPAALPQITAVIKPVEELSKPVIPNADPSKEYKLESEEGISTVPTALERKPELNTPAKIETKMKTVITDKSNDIPEIQTKVIDVVLMISTNGGSTWTKADQNNFPSSGLTVTIPYPAGTGKDSHNFVIAHMFTNNNGDGKNAGDVEYPAVSKTANGLQFTVTGLSPISIGWKETPKPVAPESNNSNNDSDSLSSVVPSFDWPSVRTAIAKLADGSSYEKNVKDENKVPEYIWKAIKGRNITVTFVRGNDRFVFNGLDLQNSGFDETKSHNLTELKNYIGRSYEAEAPVVQKKPVTKVDESKESNTEEVESEEETVVEEVEETIEETTEESEEAIDEDVPEDEEEPVANPVEKGNSSWVWILIVALVVVASAAGFFIWKKKQNEE